MIPHSIFKNEENYSVDRLSSTYLQQTKSQRGHVPNTCYNRRIIYYVNYEEGMVSNCESLLNSEGIHSGFDFI